MLEQPVEVVASRQLELTSDDGELHSVDVRLGRPIESPGGLGYCCPFQILGFGTGTPKWSRGEDALAALQNALAALEAEVCILRCSFRLRRPGAGDGDTGLRDVPSLRDVWEAWIVRFDYGRAVSLARPLAEDGIAFAQKILGLSKWLGLGTPADLPGAVSWLKRAAEQGEADACDALANMYLSSQIGDQADPEAGSYYREMARRYGIQM
jgi:TPR repeat protein